MATRKPKAKAKTKKTSTKRRAAPATRKRKSPKPHTRTLKSGKKVKVGGGSTTRSTAKKAGKSVTRKPATKKTGQVKSRDGTVLKGHKLGDMWGKFKYGSGAHVKHLKKIVASKGGEFTSSFKGKSKKMLQRIAKMKGK